MCSSDLDPGANPRCHVVPKKEGATSPINRDELGRKLSIASSIFNCLMLHLAGSILCEILQEVVFFSIFFSNIFVATYFKQANKSMCI